jgi:phage terminase small subunit
LSWLVALTIGELFSITTFVSDSYPTCMEDSELPTPVDADKVDEAVGARKPEWMDLYERTVYVRGQRKSARDELTNLEEAFVNEFMVDRNQTQAITRASGTAKNASQRAQQIMLRPRVIDALEILKAEHNRKLERRKELLLEELGILAHSDADQIGVDNDTGHFTTKPGMKRMTRAISGKKHRIRHTTIGDETTVEHTVEYRLWDKNAAARTLLQQSGALPEHHRVGGPNGEPLPTAAVLVIKEVAETAGGE